MSSNVIFAPVPALAMELPSLKLAGLDDSKGFINAARLFLGLGMVVELFMLESSAKLPLGLIGAIFRFDREESLDVKDMTSSMAQSGMRFLVFSFLCLGMNRSLRQFTFVGTLPRSCGVLKVAFVCKALLLAASSVCNFCIKYTAENSEAV